MTDTTELTEDERTSRLVVRLGELVQNGARIEERTTFGAVVLARTRAHVLPNLTMILAGLALFAITTEPLFALAALLSAFGWHRKVLESDTTRRLLVRVDELGRVKEVELGRA